VRYIYIKVYVGRLYGCLLCACTCVRSFVLYVIDVNAEPKLKVALCLYASLFRKRLSISN
jgi:hypothetical protein